MKKVPEDNPGLAKLPEEVRNRMGYLEKGKRVKEAPTRGTPEQSERAAAYEQMLEEERKKYMDYIEEQLSDNRGGKK